MDKEQLKKQAALAALQFIQHGMVVGVRQRFNSALFY